MSAIFIYCTSHCAIRECEGIKCLLQQHSYIFVITITRLLLVTIICHNNHKAIFSNDKVGNTDRLLKRTSMYSVYTVTSHTTHTSLPPSHTHTHRFLSASFIGCTLPSITADPCCCICMASWNCFSIAWASCACCRLS